VFIAAVWTQMVAIEARVGGTLTTGVTLEHFKAWLMRSRLYTSDGTEHGARLVVLCRADLVAAMDPARVAASEIVADGAAFHFVLDPAVARDDYSRVGPPWTPRRGARSRGWAKRGRRQQLAVGGSDCAPGFARGGGGRCRRRLVEELEAGEHAGPARVGRQVARCLLAEHQLASGSHTPTGAGAFGHTGVAT
jgi:hypothetical protein